MKVIALQVLFLFAGVHILVMIQALTSYRAYPSKQPQVRYTLRYGTDGLVLFSRN